MCECECERAYRLIGKGFFITYAGMLPNEGQHPPGGPDTGHRVQCLSDLARSRACLGHSPIKVETDLARCGACCRDRTSEGLNTNGPVHHFTRRVLREAAQLTGIRALQPPQRMPVPHRHALRYRHARAHAYNISLSVRCCLRELRQRRAAFTGRTGRRSSIRSTNTFNQE